MSDWKQARHAEFDTRYLVCDVYFNEEGCRSNRSKGILIARRVGPDVWLDDRDKLVDTPRAFQPLPPELTALEQWNWKSSD